MRYYMLSQPMLTGIKTGNEYSCFKTRKYGNHIRK